MTAPQYGDRVAYALADGTETVVGRVTWSYADDTYDVTWSDNSTTRARRAGFVAVENQEIDAEWWIDRYRSGSADRDHSKWRCQDCSTRATVIYHPAGERCPQLEAAR
jgi:hypothetical protein